MFTEPFYAKNKKCLDKAEVLSRVSLHFVKDFFFSW
jgi:hypothetical protein